MGGRTTGRSERLDTHPGATMQVAEQRGRQESRWNHSGGEAAQGLIKVGGRTGAGRNEGVAEVSTFGTAHALAQAARRRRGRRPEHPGRNRRAGIAHAIGCGAGFQAPPAQRRSPQGGEEEEEGAGRGGREAEREGGGSGRRRVGGGDRPDGQVEGHEVDGPGARRSVNGWNARGDKSGRRGACQWPPLSLLLPLPLPTWP